MPINLGRRASIAGLAATILFTGVTVALELTRPEVQPVYVWSTHHLKSTMAWDACRFGPSSCRPNFHPVPDGTFRGLTCNDNPMTHEVYCAPMTYVYWSDENCNRTTACGLYRRDRGTINMPQYQYLPPSVVP